MIFFFLLRGDLQLPLFPLFFCCVSRTKRPPKRVAVKTAFIASIYYTCFFFLFTFRAQRSDRAAAASPPLFLRETFPWKNFPCAFFLSFLRCDDACEAERFSPLTSRPAIAEPSASPRYAKSTTYVDSLSRRYIEHNGGRGRKEANPLGDAIFFCPFPEISKSSTSSFSLPRLSPTTLSTIRSPQRHVL